MLSNNLDLAVAESFLEVFEEVGVLGGGETFQKVSPPPNQNHPFY